MIDSFPGPVLAVSSDAISQLDAGDVLPGLWTLFSKCKASLKEGHRLENISWRLWYREFAAVHYTPPTPDSVSPAPSEKSRPTPDSQPSIPGQPIRCSGAAGFALRETLASEPVAPPPLPCSPAYFPPHVDNRSSNTQFSQSFVRTRYIGRIICDMLSHQIAYPPKRISPAKVSLPTPTSEYFPKIAAPAAPATQKTDPVLPEIQLPSTPPDRDTPCPRVVVVDPTPSPSPHPTPPTTPVVSQMAASPISHGSLFNLLPPPLPLPALTVTGKAPVASSLTASRPSQLPVLPFLPPPNSGTSGPADRLFFLSKPASHSPECEPDSGTPRPISDRASSTSSSRKAAPTTNNRRNHAAPPRARKAKEATRHVVRPRVAHNGRPPQIRRTSTIDAKARATFNIGSLSSGSKSAERARAEQAAKEMALGADVAPPIPRVPSAVVSPSKAGNVPVRRRVVVASTSSEYETTDEDDGSWAEDEISVEDVGKMTKDEIQLREAALEAKRQREMFAKIPKRSYSNLNRSRSGLLTQLLNPDPSIFPPNHPYHTSFSTQELSNLFREGRNFAQPVLHPSKSAAALPLAAPVVATRGSANKGAMFEHKSRGRPAGEQMEDDSDSGDDNPNNAVPVSRSVAQEKLAALVGMQRSNRSITTNASGGTNAVNHLPPTKTTTTTVTAMVSGPIRPGLQHVSTAPIPLSHPYNLPAPALPSTPRTTRRQMLQTELSESLRRNLLWERQVSKVNVVAGARRKSSGGPIGGLRPLTALNGNANTANEKQDLQPQQQQQQQQRPMTRHRSWADDYHSKGW